VHRLRDLRVKRNDVQPATHIQEGVENENLHVVGGRGRAAPRPKKLKASKNCHGGSAFPVIEVKQETGEIVDLT